MFCDLVGSTALAARLDAEDWRNLVSAYLDEASAAVTGLSGHVLKKLGDGLMALFGYPQAEENDAERAVRAALAIQRSLADLNARNARKGMPELSARIGIESGPVVVDATGEVFGDAPNVAARVQAAAEPGSVLVTANVQRQVAGLFVAEEKGAHELKGLPEPVSLYRIDRASGAGRRKGARALTPFVGREEDLARLARRWERARTGDGQLVLIVGEPGIGKSRLLEEFHAKLGETPHTWVEWSASQLLQNTPLHPIAEWGRQRFPIDTPGEQRLADLEASLKQVKLDSSEYAPLLAPLLDIPIPPGRALTFSPEEMRRRQLAAILAWIMAGARTQPIVLAFEDLQWADPTSIDVLWALSEQGAQAAIFIVATTRPEFRPPWTMRSHHSALSLSPLDPAEVGRMIAELASRHALSRDVVKGVSERTAGVPLFVEEVTRLLLEKGDEGGAQAIPPTLQQSLAARLDRLGEAREIAQIGAVLGRGFSYALLHDVIAPAVVAPVAAVAPVATVADRGPVGGVADPALQSAAADRVLQSALDRLVDADILFVEGLPPQANYRFKHALIQDAAYDSLLKSRRQTLHRRAAEILRDEPERAAAEPELIAHHFTQAGIDDLAIEWWGKAGDQALRRSAFQEAIAHLGKAIAMSDKAGSTAPRQGARDAAAASRHRLKLQADYGQAVMWSKGFAAEETRAAFARAAELAGPSEQTSARFVAYDAQCQRSFMRGEYAQAQETAEIFLREAEAEGRATEAGAARRMLGFLLLFQSDLKSARSMLDQALNDYVPERDGETQLRFSRDTEVTSAAYLALAEWHLGEVEQARQLINRAITRAQELGHAAARANALFWKTILESRRDAVSATSLAASDVVGLSDEYNIKTYADTGRIYQTWAVGRLRDPEVAANELAHALAAFLAQGNKVDTPSFHGMLAELEVVSRGPSHALARIDEGLKIAEETGERLTDSYLHRLRGDIQSRTPADPGPAEVSYRMAMAIAKEQGARSYELLASFALAKLYEMTGRPAEAHAILAPALDGFSPTPEMPEIAEAQALLAALAESDEVKTAVAERERRLRLESRYAQAVGWTKGFAAPETRAAFDRVAQAITTGSGAEAERTIAHMVRWATTMMRGETVAAREAAKAWLAAAEAAGSLLELAAANRNLGAALVVAGDLAEGARRLEQAIQLADRSGNVDPAGGAGPEPAASAAAHLSLASWIAGEPDRSRALMGGLRSRAPKKAGMCRP